MKYVHILIVAVLMLLGPMPISVDAAPSPNQQISWAVYEVGTSQPITWEYQSVDMRPIASLTKLMTAHLVLQSNPDLSQVVTIRRDEAQRGSTTILRANDKVTIETLLYLMLVSSDNVAARALARTTSESIPQFVARMNSEAQQLGMMNTTYQDPSGLLRGNISTVQDLLILIRALMAETSYSELFHTPIYTARFDRNRRPISVIVHNTNRLLDESVELSKTGYTSVAGYCLVQQVRHDGRVYVLIVVGAPTKDFRAAIMTMLIEWTRQSPQ